MSSIVGYSYKSAFTLTQSGGSQIRLKPQWRALRLTTSKHGSPQVNTEISVPNTV